MAATFPIASTQVYGKLRNELREQEKQPSTAVASDDALSSLFPNTRKRIRTPSHDDNASAIVPVLLPIAAAAAAAATDSCAHGTTHPPKRAHLSVESSQAVPVAVSQEPYSSNRSLEIDSLPTRVTAQLCPAPWLHFVFKYLSCLQEVLPVSQTCRAWYNAVKSEPSRSLFLRETLHIKPQDAPDLPPLSASLWLSPLRHHVSGLSFDSRMYTAPQLFEDIAKAQAQLPALRTVQCTLTVRRTYARTLPMLQGSLHFPVQLRTLDLDIICPPHYLPVLQLTFERLVELINLTSLTLTLRNDNHNRLPCVPPVAFLKAMPHLTQLREHGLFFRDNHQFAEQAAIVRRLPLQMLIMDYPHWTPARANILLQAPVCALTSHVKILRFYHGDSLCVSSLPHMESLLPVASSLTELYVEHKSCLPLLPRFTVLRTLRYSIMNEPNDDISDEQENSHLIVSKAIGTLLSNALQSFMYLQHLELFGVAPEAFEDIFMPLRLSTLKELTLFLMEREINCLSSLRYLSSLQKLTIHNGTIGPGALLSLAECASVRLLVIIGVDHEQAAMLHAQALEVLPPSVRVETCMH